MRGRVATDGREATISLSLLGESDRVIGIDAVIDTGFTGYLTLPPNTVRLIDLPTQGVTEVELADGSTTAVNIYEARLRWRSGERSVLVHAIDSDPLVGMSLLRGNRLTVNIVPDGDVLIEELS